ncbi:MAG: hypothetical protein R3B70_06175 [Polyangiaceae bacterium]
MPSACASTSFWIIVRDLSSILMNLTPMPPGRSSFASVGSRFHTTLPTPDSIVCSSWSRISNFSNVPGGKGDGVLMKMPPRLTSFAWCSMNSSTVALL